jgi:hypothetical protein
MDVLMRQLLKKWLCATPAGERRATIMGGGEL